MLWQVLVYYLNLAFLHFNLNNYPAFLLQIENQNKELVERTENKMFLKCTKYLIHLNMKPNSYN